VNDLKIHREGIVKTKMNAFTEAIPGPISCPGPGAMILSKLGRNAPWLLLLFLALAVVPAARGPLAQQTVFIGGQNTTPDVTINLSAIYGSPRASIAPPPPSRQGGFTAPPGSRQLLIPNLRLAPPGGRTVIHQRPNGKNVREAVRVPSRASKGLPGPAPAKMPAITMPAITKAAPVRAVAAPPAPPKAMAARPPAPPARPPVSPAAPAMPKPVVSQAAAPARLAPPPPSRITAPKAPSPNPVAKAAAPRLASKTAAPPLVKRLPPPPPPPTVVARAPEKTEMAAAAPPPPKAPPLQATTAPKRQKVATLLPAGDNLLQVRFRAGSSVLTDQDEIGLKSMVKKVAATETRLQLKAYAEAKGNDTSKARRLSLSRALAVRSFLIENGLRSTRIDVRALGIARDGGAPDRVDIVTLDR
jgi:outer membrane protein OmpA-like peptidoglycan-associated protein